MSRDETGRGSDSEDPPTLRTIADKVSESQINPVSLPEPCAIVESDKSLGTIGEDLSNRHIKTENLADPYTIRDLDCSLRTLADQNDNPPPSAADDSPQTIRDADRSLNTIFEGNAPTRAVISKSSGTLGRFQILRSHARGGLGNVSVALDRELNREVALKEILSQFSDDTNARERFILEAEITGGLEHPGIVPVYSLGKGDDGQPYYAMRFIKGDSLKKVIDEFHQTDNPNRKDPGERQLALRQLLDKFIDVCNAMEYAHSRGVLHRDLKPANIMVGKYGETLVVDWGLAKAMGQKEIGAESPLHPISVLSGSVQTLQGSAMGTPAYMSPEQAAGKLDELGPATDIYSLGATLYHLLCGCPSIERDRVVEMLRKVRQGEFRRPRDVLPEIPRGLEAICLKGMALLAEDRYSSARAFADDVEHWLADEPIGAAEDTPSERLTRWGRKHKGLVQAGSVSLALIALIASAAYTIVSVSNSRLKTANVTIGAQNTEIKEKNKDLETANVDIAAARDQATSLVREASRSDFATAHTLLADGKWREAMAYLGRGLRYDVENSNARDSLWMTLRHGQRDSVSLPRALLKHDDAVLSANFSLDGSRLITASRDRTARIWETRTGHQVGPTMTHRGPVISANFSPDGKRVVTISDEKTVQIWDSQKGTAVEPPLLEADQVSIAMFSPDGMQILTAGGDGSAQIWDVDTAQPIGPPLRHQDAIISASFSPEGSRVITASGDTTAQVWDVKTSQAVGPPLRHQGAVFSASFSPDGIFVLTTSSDTTARIWDASTGQPIHSPWNHNRSITTGSFSPDGTRVITASDDKTAKIWDVETGLPIGRPLVHQASVTDARFSSDGTRVLTASEDLTARIWEAQTGHSIGRALNHSEAINSVCFSPDGITVLTASDDLTAGIWNAQTGQPAGFVLRHEDAVYDAVFSPDGRRVVTASGDTTSRIWDAQTGQFIGLPLKHNRSITSVRFSPDGTRIVTASDDSTARIWNAETGQLVGKPLTHSGVVACVNFSPDGTRIVTGSHDTTGRIWNAETGEPIGLPLKHENFVSAACFSPDSEFVVTASRDKSARIWNARTGQPIGMPLLHDDVIYSACFSPDGRQILTASRDRTARIWDARNGSEKIGSRLKHLDSVYIAAFHPEGTRVLTVSEDRTMRMWDPILGEETAMPMVHESRINSAFFSPGGSRILTANEDKSARIWDTDTGQPIGPPLMHASSLNQAKFSPDGTQIVSAADGKMGQIWDVRSNEILDSRVAEFMTIVTAGTKLGRLRGTLETVSMQERLSLIPRLQSSLHKDSDWSILIQMDLDPQPDSRISPRSAMARRQAITNLIRSHSPEQIRQALPLDPGHPLIQIALASLKEFAKQADFLREYGVSHLPQGSEYCRDAAEMLLVQKDFSRTVRALDAAYQLEPNHPATIGLIEITVKALEQGLESDGLHHWLDRARNRLADHYDAIGAHDTANVWRDLTPADAMNPLNRLR